MSHFIDELVNRVLRSNLAIQADLVPCSDSEIALVQNSCVLPLPQLYVEFLGAMGKGAGKFLRGSSLFYPELLNLQDWASEILAERSISQLGQENFVFFMHQGYQFAYFSNLEGEDPQVWSYCEGWREPYPENLALSAYFLNAVDAEAETWSQLKNDL